MTQKMQTADGVLLRVRTDTFIPLGICSAQNIGSVPMLQNNQSNRCLAHCWLDDDQREQGQRCLVACWQSSHHGCAQNCLTCASGSKKSQLEDQSHRCHNC